MSIDTLEDADRIVEALEAQGWRRPPWEDAADENFFWKPKGGGYRARHVQLVEPGGRLSVELQLVPREIANAQERAHKYLEVVRDPEVPTAEREAAEAKMEEIFVEEWAKFAERTGATDPNADISGPPSGVHPLAPTAQVSEQLPSAGIFQEGTATEAPKSTKIVRDLQEVLQKQLEGLKVSEGGFMQSLGVEAAELLIERYETR